MMVPDRNQLASDIKTAARELGFVLCGVANAGPIPRVAYLHNWLALGRAGSMAYLHRHVNSREDMRSWLPWARSVIVCACPYAQEAPAEPPGAPHGRVAMYAWGRDYHEIIRHRLVQLDERVQRLAAAPVQTRICVDTSAIVERELAAAAGIGWIGKNTMMIHPAIGSTFFLGELITDLDLPADRPEPDHCGSCTRCLDACPTAAFPQPYTMDASRCISYLTIEHRGDIDPALAPRMADWVFGCDICQDVCPYNRNPPGPPDPLLAPARPDAAFPSLEKFSQLTDDEIREMNRGRATSRAKPEMWRRNAAIAQQNLKNRAAATGPQAPP